MWQHFYWWWHVGLCLGHLCVWGKIYLRGGMYGYLWDLPLRGSLWYRRGCLMGRDFLWCRFQWRCCLRRSMFFRLGSLCSLRRCSNLHVFEYIIWTFGFFSIIYLSRCMMLRDLRRFMLHLKQSRSLDFVIPMILRRFHMQILYH